MACGREDWKRGFLRRSARDGGGDSGGSGGGGGGGGGRGGEESFQRGSVEEQEKSRADEDKKIKGGVYVAAAMAVMAAMAGSLMPGLEVSASVSIYTVILWLILLICTVC